MEFDAIKIKNECAQWIRNWFSENGPNCNAVVGISGGKDSSVVAALCVEALGADRVIGVLMPNIKQDDIEYAYKLVDALDIQFTVCNIGKTIQALEDAINYKYSALEVTIDFSTQSKINLPARIRMATLYAVAQSTNGRV